MLMTRWKSAMLMLSGTPSKKTMATSVRTPGKIDIVLPMRAILLATDPHDVREFAELCFPKGRD